MDKRQAKPSGLNLVRLKSDVRKCGQECESRPSSPIVGGLHRVRGVPLEQGPGLLATVFSDRIGNFLIGQEITGFKALVFQVSNLLR